LQTRRRKLVRMSSDDTSDLRLRPGKIRDQGRGAARRPRSFVAQVMKAVTKAKGAGIGPTPTRGPHSDRRRDGALSRPRKGRCCRIGRGQAAADRLKLAAERRGPSERMRRVVVKARIVKLKLGSKGADAHLRYLQRDGTDREGEKGRLYGAETDAADGRSFLEQAREDRHQFRFIVAPEDGDQLSDLRVFTRDVMKQMEADLGTKLDWVAVDHFNTGHPHSHVVIRGKDDAGKDLIIAQDYITDGVRLRAQELATLELGPETDLELRSKLTAEIAAERFTRIDRAMLAEASEGALDLRPETGQVRADFDRTLRIGRLQTLARYSLATESEPGVWKLSDQLEPTLRELGERGDIVKAINRALKARGEERALESYSLHGEEAKTRITGRVIDKRLTDELGERLGLVIDGVDGRVHHVALGSEAMANVAEEASFGAIVEIAPAPASPRPADRNIVQLAGDSGEYRPSVHRIMTETGRVRVPGGDYNAYVESHIRRLEALRRAGIVERIDADHWRLPPDYEARAADYDAKRRGRVTLRVLSSLDLEAQIDAKGATWLDREMTSSNRAPIMRAGFGAEVDRAMKQRRETLVAMGHARRTPDNVVRVPADVIARLERQEIERVGKSMAADKQTPFKMKAQGERVSGVFTGTTNLVSGKYAIIENAYEFTLVPWRPVMDERLGRQISGVVRDSGISWDFTRTRGIGIGM
jgi:type IV secretory pathway VirD2 relaxase